jgi:hypothetical protein
VPPDQSNASAATISGTITDASGKPVRDARIDHTGLRVVVLPGSVTEPSPGEARTDENGFFSVTTVAPAIVIRKPGFISQRLAVTDGAQTQITLQRIKTESRCGQQHPPKVKTKKADDADYTATWSYITTRHGRKGILSGRGALYSLGAPSDSHVWRSVEYAETMDENGMIDAARHTGDGLYWRSRSVLGAAAHPAPNEVSEKDSIVLVPQTIKTS